MPKQQKLTHEESLLEALITALMASQDYLDIVKKDSPEAGLLDVDDLYRDWVDRTQEAMVLLQKSFDDFAASTNKKGD